MRACFTVTLVTAFLIAVPRAEAQRSPRKAAGDDDLVTRLMRYDKDKDGKLTKSELTDQRLRRLFDRADADKDGIVTKDELAALAAQDRADDRGRGGPDGFGPPGGGPDGFGPPGFGPPGGGPGGPGGMRMGPPRPGEVLPQPVQQSLNLTDKQKKQLAELQKDVDQRLGAILTAEQKQQIEQMRRRGPGGPGGFGGPPGGGPGGFGGPPPRGGPGGPPSGGPGGPPGNRPDFN